MMFRRVSLTWMVVGLASAGLLAGCGKRSSACDDGQPSLKLGMIIPISGNVLVGEVWQTAARQAANDVNATGGVNDRCIELVVRDTQSDPAEAVKQASELMASGDVSGLLFQQSTDVAGLILNVYADNSIPWPRLPILCAGCTAPDFDGLALPELEGAGLLWRMTENNSAQGVALAELASERGYQSAGYYVVDNPFGTGLANQFIGRFTELGGASHADWQQTHPTAGDINPAADLGNIYDSSAGTPEVIIINSLPTVNVAALQAWENDFAAASKILLTFTSFGLDIVTAAGLSDTNRDAVEGVSYAVGGGFRGEQFLHANGQEIAIPFTDMYYDAVFAFALAALASDEALPQGADIQRGLQKINAADGEIVGYGDFAKAAKLLAANGQINFQGVSGDLDWDLENNNSVSSPLIRWRIEAGKVISEEL